MSTSSDSRRSEALAVLERLESGASQRVEENLDAFHPEATEILLGFAFTDVISREQIALRTREMMTVAMLAAMGTAHGQLEFHIRAALNTGVTEDEIVEIIFQVAVYAGIPAAMNAITAAKSTFAARKSSVKRERSR